MKRLITLLLAMVMALSLVVPAWAENPDTLVPAAGNPAATDAHNVTVSIAATSPVYKVEVRWTSLDFVYTHGAWDTTDHRYAEGTWSGDGQATITVLNHSNAPIWYTAKLNEIQNLPEAYENVAVVLKKDEQIAQNGTVSGTVEKFPVGQTILSDEFTVNISGTLEDHSLTGATPVRTLTVTISTSNP